MSYTNSARMHNQRKNPIPIRPNYPVQKPILDTKYDRQFRARVQLRRIFTGVVNFLL